MTDPRSTSARSTSDGYVTELNQTVGMPTLDSMRPERGAAGEPWTVHVIADSDTRWKWGAAVAHRLSPDPVTVRGHLLEGRATPNNQQLADVGAEADSVRRVGIARLLADLAVTDAEVVVLACVGGTIQSLLHGLARAWQGRATRPVVVTGYVGVVYERLVDGLLLRAGSDLVLANSAADARRFRDVYSAVDVDPHSVVQTALPFLGGEPHDPTAAGRGRPFTVTFVAQPSVPATRAERSYALAQAVEHAVVHPERRVIVKLRARVGEQSTHVERHHYVDLLRADHVPPNVEIAYGQMSDVLDRTDLCVTVSSTAALEAMHREIPTAVLTDFGVREALGNHAFLHSGALVSWAALHSGEIPKTDPGWAADNGVRGVAPDAAVHARIVELVSGRAQLPALRPWFVPEGAPCYLPKLLARNGLDVDGSPLAGDLRWSTADPGLRRRAVRATARRLYRVGVRRFEPRLRRWAQL
jgi:hypothetical protein